MANKMLIDATHPEETRVVVVRGNRVEEFDFESENRKQLRGNIYLAKVTRVEPSLQAAFIDYGGNRHGFLAFSEIHPDYYQIPVADRQALIEAEALEVAEEERENANSDEAVATKAGEETSETVAEATDSDQGTDKTDSAASETGPVSGSEDGGDGAVESDGPETIAAQAEPAPAVAEPASDGETGEAAQIDKPQESGAEAAAPSEDIAADSDADGIESVESVGAEDAMEELPVRRRGRQRQYKIQEVIKRRQILLVQVVKEERGNKGAAMTTYLSLAGRYSVLMPNTARGGGISRKITNVADRKRLKQVVSDLQMPEGMGVILRTAGASRTKAEVKRDFEYLLRLWENVRSLTMRSSAPTIVYEEGSLIKRSIRDLYNKEIDEVQVAGDEAYREAKDFMRMLMPSHAKNVKLYRDDQPLFIRTGIESQLDAMFSPQVTLRSGGYIVINQTEALVAIDVNSGRSTREHNIEDTAAQTNLEAAEEVARQLRLRDLAGLIVIDFIDMEENRNNRAVERKLKDALKHDRARIQIGRISAFGLMEMSRQRLRTGVLESTTTVCPTCVGAGHVRAPSSVALHVLRSLEDHLLKNSNHHVAVRTRTPAALYVLNQKRTHLSELEQRFGLTITIEADDTIADGSHFALDRGEAVTRREVVTASVQPDSVLPDEDADDAVEADAQQVSAEEPRSEPQEREEGSGRRKRRRRGRRDPSEQTTAAPDSPESGEDGASEPVVEEADAAASPSTGGSEESTPEEGAAPRRRRRGRRGGRRGRRGNGEANGEASPAEGEAATQDASVANTDQAASNDPGAGNGQGITTPDSVQPQEIASVIEASPVIEAAPMGGDAPVSEAAPAAEAASEPDSGAAITVPDSVEPAQRPEEREPTGADTAGSGEVQPVDLPEADTASESSESEPTPDDDQPKRSGWWQRRSFF
jgi:ribonuclease E